jgi:hypothetical protein
MKKNVILIYNDLDRLFSNYCNLIRIDVKDVIILNNFKKEYKKHSN